MTTESVSLFVNPTAARGRTGRRLPRIRELLDEAGVHSTLFTSRAVGDLEAQVREQVAAGATKIIVTGGDGSIHEAVNGIMSANASAALGVIPSGTGNDFAKASMIPLDWESATKLLANRIAVNAQPRTIDIGRMNGRYFANGAGVGFDAKVTAVARAYRWPIGDLIYLVAILRAMVDGIATPELTITGDDELWSGPITLANISNGPWVGGMFYIAPMADNSDEQLELIIAAPVTRTRILRLLPKLMQGQHLNEPEIHHSSVRQLHISAKAPIPSHLDGEVQPLQSTFDIEILPAALKLL